MCIRDRYIYNSKLEEVLNLEELYFYKLVLTHYADSYYNKFIKEINTLSKTKTDNLKEIFTHFAFPD